MQDEVRSIGSHPKSNAQIARKQELEIDMDLVDKTIVNLKGKVKEIEGY